MSNQPMLPRDACPHCRQPVGLSWWNLLPSRENNRIFTCKACNGHFDLANSSKMASVIAGMAGMAVAMMYPFQWIVRAGGGTKSAVVAGIAVAATVICVAAMTAARLTLRLEARP